MSLNPAEWDIWVAIGFLGQICFSARFLIQWVTSERERKSVIPIYFWYFSLIGGMILAVYAFHRRDPVFLLGQSMGILIYVRNLMLIHRARREGKQPGLPEIPV